MIQTGPTNDPPNFPRGYNHAFIHLAVRVVVYRTPNPTIPHTQRNIKKNLNWEKTSTSANVDPPKRTRVTDRVWTPHFHMILLNPFHLAEIRGATEVSRYWSWINKTKGGKKEFRFFFFFQIKEKIKMGKCGISRSANDDFLSLCASVGRNIRLENSGMKGKKQKKKPGTEARFHYPRWSSIREP